MIQVNRPVTAEGIGMKCKRCGTEVFYLARGRGKPYFACAGCGYRHDLNGPAPLDERVPSTAALASAAPEARRQRTGRAASWRTIRSRQL